MRSKARPILGTGKFCRAYFSPKSCSTQAQILRYSESFSLKQVSKVEIEHPMQSQAGGLISDLFRRLFSMKSEAGMGA